MGCCTSKNKTKNSKPRNRKPLHKNINKYSPPSHTFKTTDNKQHGYTEDNALLNQISEDSGDEPGSDFINFADYEDENSDHEQSLIPGHKNDEKMNETKPEQIKIKINDQAELSVNNTNYGNKNAQQNNDSRKLVDYSISNPQADDADLHKGSDYLNVFKTKQNEPEDKVRDATINTTADNVDDVKNNNLNESSQDKYDGYRLQNSQRPFQTKTEPESIVYEYDNDHKSALQQNNGNINKNNEHTEDTDKKSTSKDTQQDGDKKLSVENILSSPEKDNDAINNNQNLNNTENEPKDIQQKYKDSDDKQSRPNPLKTDIEDEANLDTENFEADTEEETNLEAEEFDCARELIEQLKEKGKDIPNFDYEITEKNETETETETETENKTDEENVSFIKTCREKQEFIKNSLKETLELLIKVAYNFSFWNANPKFQTRENRTKLTEKLAILSITFDTYSRMKKARNKYNFSMKIFKEIDQILSYDEVLFYLSKMVKRWGKEKNLNAFDNSLNDGGDDYVDNVADDVDNGNDTKHVDGSKGNSYV